MKLNRGRRSMALESLETRRLLSAAADIVSLSDLTSNSTQVAPAQAIEPTYQVYVPSDEPYQTAGPEGFSPSQIRDAYGLNQVTFGDVTGNGAGQTIALIDAYNDPTIQNDLTGFDAEFNLPSTTFSVVNQDGGSSLPSVDPAGPGTDNWEGEEALDVEWAHAMAPGANIILVEATNDSPSNLFAAADWARDDSAVSVVSMSFGGNETSSETQYDSIFTTPSGHTGVTFVASSGDSGEPSGYPAYSPSVLGVGGTSLSIDSLGNYESETGWSGSGGGISQVEAQPSYQKGVVTQSTEFRTAPDVAFDADPDTGVSVYDSYNNGTSTPWEVIGGTSLGAPSWSGIIAVADQGRVIDGKGTLDGSTQTLPLIYAAPASVFHDITAGFNGFSAGVGYDLVTGLGTPVANLLIPYLVTGSTTTTTPPTNGPTISSITATPSSVSEGSDFTLTANGVSDPGGAGLVLTFYEETNSVAGLQTGSGGDTAFTPITDGGDSITLDTTGATPGTYTFYAQLTDSSGAASATGTSAPSCTVVITAPSSGNSGGPSIGSITATPSPVVSGDELTLTANDITDSDGTVDEIIFYEEFNGEPGLQTGRGGDFAFPPVNARFGDSIELETTGVTGAVTFYALAVDSRRNVSAEGTDAPTVTVDITSGAVPDDPANLSAVAVSDTEVDLSFSEIDSGQTGFTIERSTDPTFDTFAQLFTINFPDVTTYTDTGLTPDETYYYRVEAFNTAGDSGFSNVASVTTSTTQLAFMQQPTAAAAGQTLGPIVVNVENQSGNILTGDDSDVTLALAGGTATLNGTLTVAAVNGVATFTGLSIDAAGTYTLVASDTADEAPAISSSNIAISPAAASQLVFATGPTSSTAGTAISPSVVVDVEDQFGNLITDNDDTLVMSVASGPSTYINGATTTTPAGGTAVFSDLILYSAGTYSLQVSDPAANISAVSGTFTVAPAAATSLIFASQPTDLTAGTTFSPGMVVEAVDSFNNLVSDFDSDVTLSLKLAPAGEVFTPVTVQASDGMATFSDIPAFDIAGGYKFKTATAGMSKGKSDKFFVTPAAAAKLVFASEPTTIASGGAEGPITVDVADQFGNILTDDDSTLVTLGVKLGPDGVTFTPVTADAVDGVATFSNVRLRAVGSYRLKATASDLTPARSDKFSVLA
jgi:Fibronectin type III domain